jgi:predicted metal-dependent peptidase
MDAEQQKEVNEKVDRALREGALLAGRLGADIPRVISDMMEPKIDWKDALRDFITSNTKGKDEYTWRMFNRRQLANDMYLPTVEDETIGELIVAIDTSGSIGAAQLAEFAAELMSICEVVQLDTVRVLWWDTRVAGEQLFTNKDYSGLVGMLKPQGGGGTHVGSVSNHVLKEDLKADCIVVFTDGWTEQPITWETTIPTLWMVTNRRDFSVPVGGKLVIFN